jgi:aminoglycoside phosphotransferase (APT) family kinase protein
LTATPAAQPSKALRGRCIAFYPGAFRPPHKVHLAAIVDLASRPDVDEVVVIIANRCRYLPGTTKALDADVARAVLAIYLHDVPRARVEIAPHNAVAHALGYLERAAPGDRLLFCAGEADLASGDDRFEDLISLQKRPDVSAEVLPLPTGALKIRATALRQALAEGDASREEFIAALPEKLSAEQRARVWSICRDGMREMNDIIEEKVRTLLEPKLVGDYQALCCVVPGKMDPVFRLRRGDGQCLFVKYAGETAESGTLGQPLKPKPRRRLSTERRAIKCLRANLRSDVELAEVVYYDKESSTLVLSEVCPNGKPLQEFLKEGTFDADIAAKAGQFLAACHNIVAENVPALWGERETDLQHWTAMLAMRTVQMESSLFSPQLRADLQRLNSLSDAARGKGFFLLDYCPKNILVGDGKIGVIDLELCASVGDPAYDLGILLGHYVLWGLSTASGDACQAALHAALAAYRREAGAAWPGMATRVAAFAGAGILHGVVCDRRIDVRGFEPRLVATAAALLSKGFDHPADTDQLLGNSLPLDKG